MTVSRQGVVDIIYLSGASSEKSLYLLRSKKSRKFYIHSNQLNATTMQDFVQSDIFSEFNNFDGALSDWLDRC